MTDWTTLRYVVVDIEGNGQQPPNLVELAVVTIEHGIIGEPASWLVKPERPIRGFATRIHGLTNRDVAARPPFSEVQEQVQAALTDVTIIAHNASADLGVLCRQLPTWEPIEVFDTLKLVRRLVPGQRSYRLGDLVTTFALAGSLPPDLKPHRATYDALVTARLFVSLASGGIGKPLSLENLRADSGGGGSDATPPLF